ncbi:hypothetical protein HH110_08975 [Stenotrophomonas sp. SAM-B]|nr:hypothetical protein [Stenotrophomonas sp. SAM-B]
MKSLLQSLQLGSSVAEFDQSLEKYFVENQAFTALIKNEADVVAGDKGTGKTALFRILQERRAKIPELVGIEVIEGFNPVGSPIFQRLVHQAVMTEGQYASLWKAYFLSLIGNWLLGIVGKDYSEASAELDRLLEAAGLRSRDDKPETIFSKIVNAVQRALLVRPAAAQVEFSLSETGLPVITPRLEFTPIESVKNVEEVSYSEAFALLDRCLAELDVTVWVAMDRLDEAFQGFPDVEVPALRALLRTYLDLLAFDKLRLKLFVRRDLFRRVIGGGFVNLTHINVRKTEISWDDRELMYLLAQRVRDSGDFLKLLGLVGADDETIFYRIFPNKVDQAERKPTSFNWMMSRIRDGNNVKPPRNLIDLANSAREVQINMDTRANRDYDPDQPLVSADAIREAHGRLSSKRVEDTLLAEAGTELGALINRFKRSKAEHNLDTLSQVLALSGDELSIRVGQLTEIGFLEELKASWKIPMLYREGLEITQGKAFSVSEEPDDGE